jgi:hypothetical protein
MKRTYGRGPSSKGLEPVSGNNIGNLSPQWPSDNEIISQGDDHLRATRRAASGSFTTIGDEPVILTGVQLTEVIRRTSKINTIRYYNGLSTNIPIGWSICDGSNGTPILIDVYLRGSVIESGLTGGNTDNLYSQESGLTDIIEEELPPHSHTFQKRPSDIIPTGIGGRNDGLDTDTFNKSTAVTRGRSGAPWPSVANGHSHTLDLGNIEPIFYSLIPIMFIGV